jgi:hypothetical protein
LEGLLVVLLAVLHGLTLPHWLAFFLQWLQLGLGLSLLHVQLLWHRLALGMAHGHRQKRVEA